MSEIQWYPGHMIKAQNNIKNELKLIDVVIELVDARLPVSSRNPKIKSLIGAKPIVIILNRSDQADPDANQKWLSYYQKQNIVAGLVDARSGAGIKAVSALVGKAYTENQIRKGSKKSKSKLRSLVIGIPNVGKSTFINRLVGKNVAKIGNKAGVTRGNQWLRVDDKLELLDTPGILWPKFDNQEIGYKLAVTGAINDNILDFEDLALHLLAWIKDNNKMANLQKAYQLDLSPDGDTDQDMLLEMIARRKGCLVSGGKIDTLRASQLLIKDYRAGKLGRITFELPQN